MSKNRSVRYTAAFLLLVSFSYIGLLVSGLSTYTSFTNPYSYIPTGPVSSIDGMGAIPLANHTVVFVLDGLRADTFYNTPKPHIESLGNWANFTAVHCSTLLSVSRTGYAVIPSGVNSTESGVISNDVAGVFRADSVWNTTIANSGTTAVVGSDDWNELFGPWLNYSLTFTTMVPNRAVTVINATSGAAVNETLLPAYHDSLVSSYARLVLERHQPTFMLVHFGGTDEAGHENGTSSESYVNAFKDEDFYVGEILDAYEAAGLLNSTLVIVAADHGQVDARPGHGEHGGTEESVLHIPLIIRGPGVIPGVYGASAHQNSIAPTIAAAMGWAVPSDCSGTILFECLNLTQQQEAIHRINLSEVRMTQAGKTVSKMGYLSIYAASLADCAIHVVYSRGNFTGGNWTAAIQDAALAQATAETVLRESWAAKAAEERTVRLVVVTAISAVVILLVAIVIRGPMARARNTATDGLRMLVVVISVLAYFGFLYIGLLLFGWRFSASYFFTSVEEFLVMTFGPTLFAIVLGGVLLLLLLKATNRVSPNKSDMTPWATAFVFLVTVVFLLTTAYFIVDVGPGLLWFAPDADRPIMYFFVVLSYLAFTLFAFLGLLGSTIVSRISRKSPVTPTP
ncbi:MAG: hypothetical protein C4K47_07355 [Candidatus Thorarchaeota archaeon]|nr:MAG: hypothetical protein C4K47_07355 [Candidatus Thorarchaeota archaeon]